MTCQVLLYGIVLTDDYLELHYLTPARHSENTAPPCMSAQVPKTPHFTVPRNMVHNRGLCAVLFSCVRKTTVDLIKLALGTQIHPFYATPSDTSLIPLPIILGTLPHP